MNMIRASLVFLALLAALTMSRAQQTQNDSITALDEVVLLDTIAHRNPLGILPTSQVGPTAFQNYSPVDLISPINQIAGVYILSGALNTNRITIRGIGARTPFGTDKLRLYYDDIPVTNGTGFSTIETYDLENLGQVEVIKGPKGTAYGTNLGGAILLRTQRPEEAATRFKNNLTIGSFGLIKNNLGFNHQEGPLTLNLRYGHLETDGYRENSRFDRDGFLLHTSYRISDRSSMSLLLNHVNYTAQIPSSLSQSAFDEDPSQAAANWLAAQGFESNRYTLLGISHTYVFSSRLENTTSVFYTYLDQFEARPFNIVDQFTNGYGLRTRFFGNFGTGNSPLEYNLGAELYTDEFHGGTFENLFRDNDGNGSLLGDKIGDNKEFRRQYNLFAGLTVPLTARFKAQAGLSLNNTFYDFRDRFNTGAANTSAERDFPPIVLPSFSLRYTASKGHLVYANISRGFSNPGLEETLTPDGALNPDISQETGTNYELGTRLFLDKGRLRITLALYRMDVKNLLVAERVGEDQFIGRNAGSTKHQGLETELNYSIPLGTRARIAPFISYTLNDHSFVDFVDGDTVFSGNPLTGVPRHRINSGLQFHHTAGFYWNLAHTTVGAIPLTDANTLSSEPYTVFNTRLGYKRAFSKKFGMQLDLGINNLWNTRYARSVLINAVGFGGAEPRFFNPGDARNYYGSLGLSYRL